MAYHNFNNACEKIKRDKFSLKLPAVPNKKLLYVGIMNFSCRRAAQLATIVGVFLLAA